MFTIPQKNHHFYSWYQHVSTIPSHGWFSNDMVLPTFYHFFFQLAVDGCRWKFILYTMVEGRLRVRQWEPQLEKGGFGFNPLQAEAGGVHDLAVTWGHQELQEILGLWMLMVDIYIYICS